MEFSQGKEQFATVIFSRLVMEKSENLLGIVVKGLEQVETDQDITGKPAVVVGVDGAYIDLRLGITGVVSLYPHRRGATGNTEGNDEKQEKGSLPVQPGTALLLRPPPGAEQP